VRDLCLLWKQDKPKFQDSFLMTYVHKIKPKWLHYALIA
jgi:hypothetical protein